MPARGLGDAYQGMTWISHAMRWAIYLRDRCPSTGVFRCLWCNHQVWCSGDPDCIRRICLDHLRPVSQGGDHQPANLVTSCIGCNNRRGATPFVEWMRRHPPETMARVLTTRRPLSEFERHVGRFLARSRPRYGKRGRPRHWTWEGSGPPPGYVPPADPTNGAPDVPW